MSGKNSGAEAGAPFFFSICVSWSPPPALELTGDLDKEDRRVGRRGKNLGAGLTVCGGGIDKHPREEGFFSQPFPSYLRQDRSHAGARLG
jgi:hypothetical protein